MAAIDYQGFLVDYAAELIDSTRDASIYEPDSGFNAGYRAALYASLYLLESELKAWGGNPAEFGFDKFSLERWRREGAGYWLG